MKALPQRELDVLLARLDAHVIELRAAFPREFERIDQYNRGMADGLEEAANTVRAAGDKLSVDVVPTQKEDLEAFARRHGCSIVHTTPCYCMICCPPGSALADA